MIISMAAAEKSNNEFINEHSLIIKSTHKQTNKKTDSSRLIKPQKADQISKWLVLHENCFVKSDVC